MFSSALASCSANPWNESNFEAQRADAREDDNYLPWEEAERRIVERCQSVTGIYQGHSRVVSVGFDSDDSLTTITPEIDQVLGVVQRCHKNFDSVVMIME